MFIRSGRLKPSKIIFIFNIFNFWISNINLAQFHKPKKKISKITSFSNLWFLNLTLNCRNFNSFFIFKRPPKTLQFQVFDFEYGFQSKVRESGNQKKEKKNADWSFQILRFSDIEWKWEIEDAPNLVQNFARCCPFVCWRSPQVLIIIFQIFSSASDLRGAPCADGTKFWGSSKSGQHSSTKISKADCC